MHRKSLLKTLQHFEQNYKFPPLKKKERKQERVKKLNKEIKEFFHEKKKSKVRRNIQPGSSASLWKAVKKANDVDIKELPNMSQPYYFFHFLEFLVRKEFHLKTFFEQLKHQK